MIVSSHFKESHWLNKMGHVAEVLHVPDAFKDFDVDLRKVERTAEEYRNSYNAVQKETFWMTFLQMVSNLLSFLQVTQTDFYELNQWQILCSASKVGEKHTALVLNIGTYPEEDAAYKLLNNLSLALPLVVVVTWVLDALLAAAYLKWFHPWKIILQEVSLSRESD